MTAMTTTWSSGPFTVDDLEGMPDDGKRYELIDGELLVSPAPRYAHQIVSMELSALLHAVCPSDLRVIPAPFAVQPDRSNEVQPDVLVARHADFTERNLPKAPVLAVEIISPSSRLVDANLKKAFYERLAAPRYWLVDPDAEAPVLTVFALVDGRYEQVAKVDGEQPYEADLPFPVRVVPARLVAGLRP